MLLKKMLEEKLVVAVRGVAFEDILDLLDALMRGGIRFVEFTFDQTLKDQSKTLRAIEYAVKQEGLLVGAGTVLTQEQVKSAFEAGAQYIVSPSVHREVIETTKEYGLLSIPGALTPSEIISAHQYGADIVKIFPAASMGESYIKALRAPIPKIPLMAMGGIDDNNIGQYYQAGANAFGVGANIVDKELIAEKNYAKIEERARTYCKCIREL